MRVLITGGSGFIGRHLAQALLARGDDVEVITRYPETLQLDPRVGAWREPEQLTGRIDAVVNLAGAPIAKRWSSAYRQVLRDSRIRFTATLVEWMGRLEVLPRVLISGSAIGYYGSQGDRELDEQAEPREGFTHQLCADWEREAQAAESLGVRVCTLRTGLVLGADGGALEKMLPPFRLGLGGPIGSGRQWISWIHMADEVGAILHLLDHEQLRGPFNLTAPHPCTNATFSRTLGQVLGRPAFCRVPAPLMRLLLGEASELVLKGQRVMPLRLLESGYAFRYSTLEAALAQVLGRDTETMAE